MNISEMSWIDHSFLSLNFRAEIPTNDIRYRDHYQGLNLVIILEYFILDIRITLR